MLIFHFSCLLPTITFIVIDISQFWRALLISFAIRMREGILFIFYRGPIVCCRKKCPPFTVLSCVLFLYNNNDLKISNFFLTSLLLGCESITFSVQVGGAAEYF